MDEEEKKYIEEQLKHVEKMITLLNKALEGASEEGIASYEFETEAGRRKVEKLSFKELVSTLELYEKKRAALKNTGKKRKAIMSTIRLGFKD